MIKTPLSIMFYAECVIMRRFCAAARTIRTDLALCFISSSFITVIAFVI